MHRVFCAVKDSFVQDSFFRVSALAASTKVRRYAGKNWAARCACGVKNATTGPLQCASSPSPCVGSGGPVFRHVTCSTCCETFSESFKDAEVAQLLDALREAGWSGWWLPKLQIAICFLYLFALLHIPFFAVGDWGWRHQLAIDGKTTRSQRSSTLKGWSWVCRWNGDWEC